MMLTFCLSYLVLQTLWSTIDPYCLGRWDMRISGVAFIAAQAGLVTSLVEMVV
jgi:hypothetical protein